jgi:hypothetical protein
MTESELFRQDIAAFREAMGAACADLQETLRACHRRLRVWAAIFVGLGVVVQVLLLR